VAQAPRNEKRPAETRPAEEVSLRVETAGHGGVPLRAVVLVEALSSIERGVLPVETTLKIRVPGYGWRAVGVRVFPSGDEGVSDKRRSVQLTVPGYDHAPLKMAFLGRSVCGTQPPRPQGRPPSENFGR
jgi:hypothetical protein